MASVTAHWHTISFSDLEQYDYKNSFDKSTAEKITQIFGPCIEKFHQMTAKEYVKEAFAQACQGTSPFTLNSALIQEWDPKWKIQLCRRTAIAEHPDLPNHILKIANSYPSTGHPMANTLRVPMAARLQTVVNALQLDQVVIPQKALIPVFSREDIAELEEREFNEGYVVVAEKMEMLPEEEMLAKAKKNTKLPNQICQLPTQTGYVDCTWSNLGMLSDGRVVAFDTEPLFGELVVQTEKLNPKFRRSFEFLTSSEYTLQKCALRGLKNFQKSSQEKELHAYEEAAQRHIDRLSS